MESDKNDIIENLTENYRSEKTKKAMKNSRKTFHEMICYRQWNIVVARKTSNVQ